MSDYLSVSALTKYLKYRFDNDKNLKNIHLKGEISNFKRHSSGHLYFTLKDDNAQISAIMFKFKAQNIKFDILDGMSVLVTGYVSIYEAGGSYQIYVDDLVEAGKGALYLKFEQLKKELEAKGLFSDSHKLPIKRYPNNIGIITSQTGAALQDILNTLQRRYPLVKVYVYPTLVQGDNAKYEIVENIKLANKQNIVDTLILARGGGSIEDLWPFNEEIVAYAVYESKIPIISGVGHEVDFTIVDFVSDLRAPTPTGAAELCVPSITDIITLVNNYQNQLVTHFNKNIINLEQKLTYLTSSNILVNPNLMFDNTLLKLDNLINRLEISNPLNKIDNFIEKNNNFVSKLKSNFINNFKNNEFRFLSLNEKLILLNPFNVMEKGYSIVKKDNQVITSLKNININDELEIMFKDGKVISNVTRKESNNE